MVGIFAAFRFRNISAKLLTFLRHNWVFNNCRGRGRTGGQIRDDFRSTFDSDRGGWSAFAIKQKEIREKMFQAQGDTFVNYTANLQPVGAGNNGKTAAAEMGGVQLATKGAYQNAKRQRLEQEQKVLNPNDASYDDEEEPPISNSNPAEISYDEDEQNDNANISNNNQPNYGYDQDDKSYDNTTDNLEAQEASYDEETEQKSYDNDDQQPASNNYLSYDDEDENADESNGINKKLDSNLASKSNMDEAA
jgi:hypothetical protein